MGLRPGLEPGITGSTAQRSTKLSYLSHDPNYVKIFLNSFMRMSFIPLATASFKFLGIFTIS